MTPSKIEAALAIVNKLIRDGQLTVIVETPEGANCCPVVSANLNGNNIDLCLDDKFGNEIMPSVLAPEALFTEQIEEDVFHDTVLDATGQSLDHDALISVFKTLPENLQRLAMQWDLADTDFNEMALKFLKDQSSP